MSVPSRHRCPHERKALTAVEVVCSTLLASMLMVAVLGVLRGIKAQETALSDHKSIPEWQRSLDSVLQQDLSNARSYELLPGGLRLQGHLGRDPGTGVATWQPATVDYAVADLAERQWLVRVQQAASPSSGSYELVLADVSIVRAGTSNSADSEISPRPTTHPMPVVEGLSIGFYSSAGRLVYAYHHQSQ